VSVTAPAKSMFQLLMAESSPVRRSECVVLSVVVMLLWSAVPQSCSIPVVDKKRKTPSRRCHRAKPICICSWLLLVRSNAAKCQALFGHRLLPRFVCQSAAPRRAKRDSRQHAYDQGVRSTAYLDVLLDEC